MHRNYTVYLIRALDRRACEKHMNTFPQFKALIIDDDGKEYSIHFAALFSKKADAVPVMLLHGWPGTCKILVPTFDLLEVKRYFFLANQVITIQEAFSSSSPSWTV